MDSGDGHVVVPGTGDLGSFGYFAYMRVMIPLFAMDEIFDYVSYLTIDIGTSTAGYKNCFNLLWTSR